MTTIEIVAVAGFSGTILANAAIGGAIYGSIQSSIKRLSDDVQEFKELHQDDGGNGFVRRAELHLLRDKADEEHEVMNKEIDSLRERSHEHANMLSIHQAQLNELRERE